MSIFSDNCSIKEVTDNNVPLLLLIQDPDNKKPFDDINIMNFSSHTACDTQIDRNASGGFTYNTFGKGMYAVHLDGFCTPGSNQGVSKDVETYYDKHCIASPDRKKIKITAAYIGIAQENAKSDTGKTATNDSQAHAEAITYSGYMTSFTKKPFGTEKVPGYGFSLELICVRETKSK